jgi:hypothetical protein
VCHNKYTAREKPGKKREKMFFKTETVFKVLATQAAAEKYVARWFANGGVRIEAINGKFFVVA